MMMMALLLSRRPSCCCWCVLCLVSASLALSPSNDVLLRCARGEAVERTPVWLFRQAGRHMSEYREFKEASGLGFLEILEDPVAVAEVTMQPLRNYDVDAAIVFSDILVCAQAVGVEVTMPGGVGITVPDPVTDLERARYVAELASHDPDWLVRSNLKKVTRSIEEIRAKQLEEQRDVALLGFSAAPWTLLYYVLGSSSKNEKPALDFLKKHPDAVDQLLDAFEALILSYCAAQIEAGAHAIQLFDAMAGALPGKRYQEIALPRLARLASHLKAKHDVPLLVFSRGVKNLVDVNRDLHDAGFDVVSLDTRDTRRAHRSKLGPNACLQGNLDPAKLITGGAGDDDDDYEKALAKLLKETHKMASDLAQGPWIANLGEGLGGKEDPRLVKAFVDAVHHAPTWQGTTHT